MVHGCFMPSVRLALTHEHTHCLLSCVFICVECGITALLWELDEKTQDKSCTRALMCWSFNRKNYKYIKVWLRSDLKLVVFCVCHIPYNKKKKNYCVL